MLSRAALALVALLAALLTHALLARARRRARAVSKQRERAGGRSALARAASLSSLLAQWGVWLAVAWFGSDAFPALASLRERGIELVGMALAAPLIELNERAISAGDVLLLPVALGALWLAANALTHGVRISLFEAAGLEGGPQEAASMLLRYGLAFVGGLVLLQASGVDVRSLAIAASVLGVGIGFGLQNIASNFVSGILISLERPIRPGDFIRVGEFVGTVERVGARSTEVRTLDRVTILVPNARLLENEVVNWSHGDPTSRVHVNVGVAYGSNVARARHALLTAARSHPAVLREPRPQVQLRQFGESSLDFELLVWTRDPQNQFSLVSDLNLRVEEELRRCGVEIPFPQRDLNLPRSAERALAALARKLEPEAAANEPVAAADAALAGEGFDPREDRGPGEWMLEEVEAVLRRMRSPGGVARGDRHHRFRVYHDCFVGTDAVDWLVREEKLTRREAVEFGARLVELGHARHVLDEHGFRDGPYFYRFCKGRG